jgi:pyrroline-5-carboxylate reductase
MAEGFDQRTSSELIAKMLTGSAALLAREPEKAAELRARVSSPNGTTAAGVAALDERQVREAFVAAVQAASRRSRELGDA